MVKQNSIYKLTKSCIYNIGYNSDIQTLMMYSQNKTICLWQFVSYW